MEWGKGGSVGQELGTWWAYNGQGVGGYWQPFSTGIPTLILSLTHSPALLKLTPAKSQVQVWVDPLETLQEQRVSKTFFFLPPHGDHLPTVT